MKWNEVVILILALALLGLILSGLYDIFQRGEYLLLDKLFMIIGIGFFVGLINRNKEQHGDD